MLDLTFAACIHYGWSFAEMTEAPELREARSRVVLIGTLDVMYSSEIAAWERQWRAMFPEIYRSPLMRKLKPDDYLFRNGPRRP